MSGAGSARSARGVVLFAVVLAVAAVTLVGVWTLVNASTEAPLAASDGERADPALVYDPVEAGEPLPSGFRQLVWRDQIEPVYDPVFTSPNNVDWPAGSLVIGVVGTETAKAYPVTHLNSREMVVDSLEGIPILVTW